jgi:homoserine O-acetyltransferase/O-succinyltransferase
VWFAAYLFINKYYSPETILPSNSACIKSKSKILFMKQIKILILFWSTILVSLSGITQKKNSPVLESDFVIKDFKFESGESLPQLNIHYTTLGQPIKDKNGHVGNAVLIMHGTTGGGYQFLFEQFANNLYNPGQILDTTKYFIILPDAIGHNKSSKPSDSMRMRFPKYTYNDMVTVNYRLLTEHLGIHHLRLVMGTSMGGMQTWVWGYTYPDFMDALMPLASLPVEIAGRNRMARKMAMNMIKMDPEWKEGEYTSQPKVGLTGAISALFFMGSSPIQLQKSAPTRIKADSLVEVTLNRSLSNTDANDFIYQFDASRNYNPSPHLSKIKAPLFAVNSADDEVNPAELIIMELEIVKVKQGRYILLPITDKTTGHGTHTNAAIWGIYLKELLELTNKK